MISISVFPALLTSVFIVHAQATKRGKYTHVHIQTESGGLPIDGHVDSHELKHK